MAIETTRTTLSLPTELLEIADRLVRTGRVRSRNALIAEALRREIDAYEQASIDARILATADDPDYLAEMATIFREFDGADTEATQLIDNQE